MAECFRKGRCSGDAPRESAVQVAAGQQGDGTLATPDHRDRHHDGAPGAGVVRVRNLQKAVLHAVLMEIDAGVSARRHHGHVLVAMHGQ
ncbi:hypothetical protein UC34_05120 [Pandoraea vervacti]|uniref:Uncharacterized protein n=1 Tax=Pandoraea vervacti TaxID=656178 RepID=A0ABM5SVI4_9BURK|nr:hypothetical protein UC34_05120 [Pandoraea vervacti]